MSHPFQMPESFVQRTVARQGSPNSVQHLDSSSTALVAVDMQRYFMEAPYAGACPVAQEIVPNVNALAAEMRRAGGLVVWLQMVAPPDKADWTALRQRYSPQATESRWGSLDPDDRGFELWPDLEVSPEDLRVVKDRYSAFIGGSSDLHAGLQARAIDTLVVAGVATNACCETTARDAMMLDYRVVMVSDACAAATDEEHFAALTNFYLYFGDVQETTDVLGLLSSSGTGG